MNLPHWLVICSFLVVIYAIWAFNAQTPTEPQTGPPEPILSISADGEILHLEPGTEKTMILHLWNQLQHCERGQE